MSVIAVLLVVAAVVAFIFREQVGAYLKERVSKFRADVSKPDSGTPMPNVGLPPVDNFPPKPEQSMEEWLASLPASTRAYIPQGKEREYRDQLVARAQAAEPVDYSGFVLRNSSKPAHNQVKANEWVEFTIVATLPRQQIQASAQAEWLDQEVNGVLFPRRQASNPTAMWLTLPPGEHKYRVRLDRDAMLDVKMSEH